MYCKQSQAQCRSKERINTETFDLDLEHYTVHDLYALFKLDINDILDDKQLKIARRYVLLSHPDKSGLNPEYFHFFTQAYRMLEQIAVMNKKEVEPKHYNRDLDNYNEEIHQAMERKFQNEQLSGKSTIEITKEFNKNFNAQFETINQDILPQNSNGYESWLKANDPHIPLEDHKTYFNQKKKELRENERNALSIYGIRDVLSSTSGSQLIDEPAEYTSDLFSSLAFTDLKKSYTEQFVPVTEEDFHSKQKYNNVDELIQERSHGFKCPTEEQSKVILQNTKRQEELNSINRAYLLASQYETAKRKNQEFSKYFFSISNE